jgi:hypothetical protein
MRKKRRRRTAGRSYMSEPAVGITTSNQRKSQEHR